MLFKNLILIYLFQYTGLHKWGFLAGTHILRLLVFGTLIFIVVQKKLTFKGRITPIITCFILFMLISLPFSYLKSASFDGLIAYLKIIVVTLLTISIIKTSKQLKTFIIFYIVVNAYIAIGASVDYFGAGAESSMQRLGAGGLAGEDFLGDPNDFALAMNIIIPFAYFYLIEARRKTIKILLLFLMLIYILGIMISYSRGGFITLVLTLFCCTLISKKYMISALVTVGLIVALIFFAPTSYKSRLSSITEMNEQDTGYGRLQLTLAGLEMMADRPLTGVGLNAFPSAYGRKYIHRVDHYSAKWRVAHNSYITIGAELGVIALLTYIYLMYLVIIVNKNIRSYLISINQRNSIYYVISESLTASLFAYAFGSFFLTACYYPHIYLICSLTVVTDRITKETFSKIALNE